MNSRKSKFLRELASVNIEEGALWEEYEEKIVKQRVMPKRKLVSELSEKEKTDYSAQVIAAEQMKEKEPYIVVPDVFSSITVSLKTTCGKYIYRQLKKAARSGKLGKLKFQKRNLNV